MRCSFLLLFSVFVVEFLSSVQFSISYRLHLSVARNLIQLSTQCHRLLLCLFHVTGDSRGFPAKALLFMIFFFRSFACLFVRFA